MHEMEIRAPRLGGDRPQTSEGSFTFILNCCLRHKEIAELEGRRGGRGGREREKVLSSHHSGYWCLPAAP